MLEATVAMLIIKAFILPPGLFILLLFSFWGLQRRLPALSGYLLLLTTVCLYFLSIAPVSYLLSAPLYRLAGIALEQPISSEKLPAENSAIVVLGGGLDAKAVEYDGKDRLSNYSLARALYAALLYNRLALPVMTVGGLSCLDCSESEAAVLANVLQEELQTPVRWQEGVSRNTKENAEHSVKLLQEAGITTIALVTSAEHMWRARMEFERLGLRVIPAGTRFVVQPNLLSLKTWLPSMDKLECSRSALHEILGVIWYAVLS